LFALYYNINKGYFVARTNLQSLFLGFFLSLDGRGLR
jgi:hypothetical protein